MQLDNLEGKLVPLRRFSQGGQYSTAYLSLLVQRKKLKAKKIGRNFFTTQEWFNEYLEMHSRKAHEGGIETSREPLVTKADKDEECLNVLGEEKKENNLSNQGEVKKDFFYKNNFSGFDEIIPGKKNTIINKKLMMVSATVMFIGFLFFIPGVQASLLKFSNPIKEVFSSNETLKNFSKKIDEVKVGVKKNLATQGGIVAGFVEGRESNKISYSGSLADKMRVLAHNSISSTKNKFRKTADKQIEISLIAEAKAKKLIAYQGKEKKTLVLSIDHEQPATSSNNQEFNFFETVKSIYNKFLSFFTHNNQKENLVKSDIILPADSEQTENIVVEDSEEDLFDIKAEESDIAPVVIVNNSSNKNLEAEIREVSARVEDLSNSLNDDSEKSPTIVYVKSEPVVVQSSSTQPVVVETKTIERIIQVSNNEVNTPNSGFIGGGLTVVGDGSFGGGFSVAGRSNLYGGVAVTGNSAVSGNLSVSGTMTVGHLQLSSLGVSGLFSAKGVSAGIGGFYTNGDSYFDGDTYFSNKTSFSDALDIGYSSANALSVGDGTGQDVLNIDTSGNIVSIFGDISASGLIDISASSSSSIITATQSGNGNLIDLYDGANKVFTVLDGGNVGIGTSTPSGLLDVYGTICFSGDCKTSWSDVTTTAGYWTAATGGIHYSSGNVGIGTTTASSLLTVGATSTEQFLVSSSGVVTGGTWQGGVINVAYGGTGLGVIAADEMIYGSGINTYATTTITAAGRAIIDDADAPAQRATLGLGSMALESNIGSTTINTLGTIVTGTWNADLIDIANYTNLATSTGISLTGSTLGLTLADIDHNSLNNLATGDVHTQYVLLNGRAGGQTLIGGTASGNNLVLNSNSSNDGYIIMNPGGGNVGIGTTTASSLLTVGATSGSQFLVSSSGVITDGTWNGDVIGLGYGGTGTSTVFTSGSILFSNGSSLAQDNNNFFWDSANKRLGIGIGNPTSKLHVYGGDLKVDNTGSGTATVSIDSNVASDSRTMLYRGGSLKWVYGNDYSDSDKFKIGLNVLGLDDKFTIDRNGNIGIGTSTVSSMLTVGATSGSQFLVSSSGVITDGTWNGDVIGLGYGGTGTSTVFTSGSILFSNGSSLAQDNNNFFWDSANKRLGLGGAPDVMLTLKQAADSSGINLYGYDDKSTSYLKTSITAAGTAFITANTNVFYQTTGGFGFAVDTDSDYVIYLGDNAGSKKFRLYDSDNVQQAYINSNGSSYFEGNMGIGTSTISSLLTVGATTGSQFLVSSSGVITDGTWNGDVIGLGYGGTGTSTAFTSGSVLFSNGTSLAQDNSSFYWDNTNKYLGIKTLTPRRSLDVLDSSNPQLRLTYTDNSVYTDIQTLSNGKLALLPSGGVVSIGTTTPSVSSNGLYVEQSSATAANLLVFSNKKNVAGATSGIRLENSNGTANMHIYGKSAVVDNDFQIYIQSQQNKKVNISNNAGTSQFWVDTSTGDAYHLGSVGIGTTTPAQGLHIGSVASGKNVMVANGGLCVDDDDNCAAGFTPGAIIAKSSNLSGADYAEYFYTVDTDLESGEVVCVDITENNAVKRCDRSADDNVMGIVSSNPSIVGNAKDHVYNNNHYKIIGMLGQVPARVSAENGPIRPGDSLTSASSVPGYAMRASAGDPTVGVALEGLDSGMGNIQVLISRRNKSLTVETIEQQITDRIAVMEIQDEVNLLVSSAINNLNIDSQIADVMDPKILLLDSKLTIEVDNLTGKINNNENNISGILSRIELAEIDINNLKNKLDNIFIDQNGNVQIGNNIDVNIASVAVVEINALSDNPAFVVNQSGSGDIARFEKAGVEVVTIAGGGKVVVVGEMAVDGRLMVCSGSSCGSTLDLAVDETMGDLGVEGKVVAGAFEGYCDDGWVWVPGSSKYGTLPGFCVMAGKADSNYESIVDGINLPMVSISQGEAQFACQSIGLDYHLLSENEWMTIADNIIKVADNDIDNINPGMQLAFGLDNFGYKLTNDNMIYDLAGSVGEWTDQTITKGGMITPLIDGAQEYSEITDYQGFNIAPPYYYDSTNGIGTIITGNNLNNLRGFVRGQSGIYGLDLSKAPTTINEAIGFRCAK